MDRFETGNSVSGTVSRARHIRTWAGLFTLLLIGAVIGLIVASNLQLPGASVAQTPVNIAQTGAFPVVERNGEMESPFVSVVERVQDAVVNISAKSARSSNVPWWYQGGDAVSSGSGFFFREDGYVLTNAHVVRNASELTVRTSSGYDYKAKLVGQDPSTDLAVLKVEPEEKITFIPFGQSDNLKVGDWAIAIGNPFPQQGLDRTVTVGVISAVGRSNLAFGRETPQYQDYIQTDASINPGNSGGPLLNLRGEAIGVNAAISSPTGSSVGIGFAIPINIARSIVPDLIATGRASRGWLGVSMSNVTEREAKRQGLAAVRGVHIDSVVANSPASQSGLRARDVILKFNNEEVQNVNQFSVLVSTVKKGASVPLEVVRDGNPVTLKATIGDRDAAFAAASQRFERSEDSGQADAVEWRGMELVPFTEQMAAEIDIRHVDGMYVTRVYPGSSADRASLAEGTIILHANNQEVTSAADFSRVVAGISKVDKVPLLVIEPDGSVARKILRP